MHNELFHYGVQGMKWGVRRHRNKYRQSSNSASNYNRNKYRQPSNNVDRRQVDAYKQAMAEYEAEKAAKRRRQAIGAAMILASAYGLYKTDQEIKEANKRLAEKTAEANRPIGANRSLS